jgi:tetratricopeptide (TPR) repeat protein
MPSEPTRQLILKAIEAIGSGKYSDALKLLDKADDIESDLPEVYELRGIAFAQTGRAEAATESFRRASTLQPSAKAFFNLAVHLYNIGEAADSLESVKKCLKLDPNNSEAKQLVARLSGQGVDPKFSAAGNVIDPTNLAYKRRYGFGRKHLFAALAENQEQWVQTGWAIVVLSIVSALLMKIVSPFHVPAKFNDHDILGGLKPIAAPYAFATIAFFLTMVLASMIWTSLDLIDRRGKALWMIPMMLCCFTCAPSVAQSLYMYIGRRDA